MSRPAIQLQLSFRLEIDFILMLINCLADELIIIRKYSAGSVLINNFHGPLQIIFGAPIHNQ